MILFMDDIHLLFGDHGQGTDSLRSILSHGAVRIIGTCGWREWRRYVEPDPGLARRIAPVRIQEPDHEGSLRIVEGIAPIPVRTPRGPPQRARAGFLGLPCPVATLWDDNCPTRPLR